MLSFTSMIQCTRFKENFSASSIRILYKFKRLKGVYTNVSNKNDDLK